MTISATSELEAILFIKCLGDGKANPFLSDPKRKRTSFIPLEILYQIYLYQKNVDRGAWNDIHTMKETIARHVGCCRTSVTNFFNSKTIGVDIFVGVARYSKRLNGKFQANRYWLKPGIQQALQFLERKGFFKNMKKDRVKWRKGFDNRLEKWLIPLLEKGLTFSQILKGDMNILSTKNEAKLAAVEARKMAYTTLPPEDSFTTQRYINNPVAAPSFAIPEIAILHSKLKDRLHIPDWQIKNFMLTNPLCMLSAAVDETISWTSGEWQPKRMPALIQKKLNEKRNRRNI